MSSVRKGAEMIVKELETTRWHGKTVFLRVEESLEGLGTLSAEE